MKNSENDHICGLCGNEMNKDDMINCRAGDLDYEGGTYFHNGCWDMMIKYIKFRGGNKMGKEKPRFDDAVPYVDGGNENVITTGGYQPEGDEEIGAPPQGGSGVPKKSEQILKEEVEKLPETDPYYGFPRTDFLKRALKKISENQALAIDVSNSEYLLLKNEGEEIAKISTGMDIIFFTNGNEERIRLCENGDFRVNGKKVENDLELYHAFRKLMGLIKRLFGKKKAEEIMKEADKIEKENPSDELDKIKFAVVSIGAMPFRIGMMYTEQGKVWLTTPCTIQATEELVETLKKIPVMNDLNNTFKPIGIVYKKGEKDESEETQKE